MQSQFSKIKKRILVLDLERKLRTNLNFVLSCANYNEKSAYIIKKTPLLLFIRYEGKDNV